MSITIDPMQRCDWARVREIYAEGLATGLAAFLKTPPRWEEWDAGHLNDARLVARSAKDRCRPVAQGKRERLPV